MKPLGTVAIVGFTGDMTLNVQNDLMAEGKSLVGVIEGDAVLSAVYSAVGATL